VIFVEDEAGGAEAAEEAQEEVVLVHGIPEVQGLFVEIHLLMDIPPRLLSLCLLQHLRAPGVHLPSTPARLQIRPLVVGELLIRMLHLPQLPRLLDGLIRV
jgi:hypothetical protein